MAEPPESLDFDRIRAKAAQTRLEAIQSQLAVCFTLCAMAETEIRIRDIDAARTLIQKLLHTAEVIRYHLDEPHRVPAASVAALRDQLAQLKNRISNVEKQLRST